MPLRAYARGRIAHLLEFGNIGPLPWPRNRYQTPLKTVCLGLGLYRKGEIGPSCRDALVGSLNRIPHVNYARDA